MIRQSFCGTKIVWISKVLLCKMQFFLLLYSSLTRNIVIGDPFICGWKDFCCHKMHRTLFHREKFLLCPILPTHFFLLFRQRNCCCSTPIRHNLLLQLTSTIQMEYEWIYALLLLSQFKTLKHFPSRIILIFKWHFPMARSKQIVLI